MSNNILFIVPQLPYPPNHGSSIRNYNLIRTLAENHTIDLLAFSVPENQLVAANPLNKICRNIATVPQPVRSSAIRILDTARRRLPDMALRLESEEMHLLVQQWTVENRHQTQYDIVQIEGIEMAQYGLAITDAFQRLHEPEAESGNSRRPVLVFDDHNCEYLLQKRNALNDLRIPFRWPAAVYSIIQWQKLKWYESLICCQMDAVSVVSPTDKAILTQLVEDVDITVISNGITLEDYELEDYESENGREPRSSAGKSSLDITIDNSIDNSIDNPYRQSKKLIFVGKMDYRPNVDAVLWFAHQVLPLIQEQEPTVVFEVVGMNPHPRLDQLRDKRGIMITGKVEEVPPYLHAATAYVIPLRVGGGTRFKALEAMAASMPIVSTRLGVEGIPVVHEQELLLADTPDEFAKEVLRLLAYGEEADALRQMLSHNGRRFVEEHYSWQTIVPELEEVYARMLRLD